MQIGPIFLPERLNGPNYVRFLRRQLPGLLDEIPLLSRLNLIFMHDGAPAHFSRVARRHLNRVFRGRWIGRSGPISWPPRSPDLNPMDYFVWGHIKNMVHFNETISEDDMRADIIAAFDTITREMAQRATNNIVRRAETCIEQEGRHFEHIL